MKNRVKHFLKEHAGMNIPLAFDEAFDLGCYALEGCHGNTLAQIQSITVLSALHNKATYGWKSDGIALEHNGHKLPLNSAEQIAGVCAAIFEQDIGKSEFKYLEPSVLYAMDNCGMGGDLITTANVSTIAALITSAAGIPMCKHGSPANADAGRHGSSDFVSLLGINTKASRMQVQKCVETEYFAYTEALDVRYKLIHQQTHTFAMLPHMNDIIGPITNPLNPHIMTRRILGVNHLVSPRIIAEVYQILNKRGCADMQHCLIVRGFAKSGHCEGMDEVSICEGGTQVAELKNGVIIEHHLMAGDFGLVPVSQASISPPSGMSKGKFSLAILKGEIGGPPLQMVLANAALLFYLAGRSADLKECYQTAKTVYESGAAYRKALAVSKSLPV